MYSSMILFFVFGLLALGAMMTDSDALFNWSVPVALVFMLCGMFGAFWLAVYISTGITVIAAVAALRKRIIARK